MIIIRNSCADKIDDALIYNPNIKHFEVVYKNKSGQFVYSNNSGKLPILINKLERDNANFILNISEKNERKKMFFVKDVGFIVFDNTYSKINDDALIKITVLINEFFEKNLHILGFELCTYKIIRELHQYEYIDKKLNIIIYPKPSIEIFNRNQCFGKFSSNRKIWISDLNYRFPLNKITTLTNKINYENLKIEVLDVNSKPLVNSEQIKIGNKLASYIKSTHNSVPINNVIQEFKRLNNLDNLTIKVNFNSHDSCEILMDDLPRVKDKIVNYFTKKELIEAYYTRKILYIKDLHHLSKKDIRELIPLYPLLFVELLQDEYTYYNKEDCEEYEKILKNKIENDDVYDDDEFDEEEYQDIKKQKYIDDVTGEVTTLVLCFQCDHEDYEETMTECIVNSEEVFLCDNCLIPLENEKKALAKGH